MVGGKQKCKETESTTERIEFWSDYLEAAHEFSNVTLVCGDGQSKATHALMLGAVNDLLRSLLLEVFSTGERTVILLPDHSMEELELGFQALLAGQEAGQEIIKDLGIAVKESSKELEANEFETSNFETNKDGINTSETKTKKDKKNKEYY